jgi:hypothetical protein
MNIIWILTLKEARWSMICIKIFWTMKMKTRLYGVQNGFEMNLLDSGNENEAMWGVICI